MKRTVINIDGLEQVFETDQEFIEFARNVYKDNEEGQPYDSELHWLPDNINNAVEYIEEYCGDLELIES